VLNELRDGDILDRDRIVGIGGDHRVAAAIIVCGGQQLLEVGKDRVIHFDLVRTGVEIAEGDVAKIGREHESITPREPGGGCRLRHRAGLRAVAGEIAGCRQSVRCEIARGIGTG
jgi:hypothetical protein